NSSYHLPAPAPYTNLFPYTTLFRSRGQAGPQGDLLGHRTRAGVLARPRDRRVPAAGDHAGVPGERGFLAPTTRGEELMRVAALADRKSTRLNSSHQWISDAVFCRKK